jgi:hypothetical protein
VGDTVAEVRSKDLIAALDEASLSRFHSRAVLVSGMGFFTDAYDLFVIGIASTLIAKEWGLSSGRLALLNSTMLAAAFLGAFVFGRFADLASDAGPFSGISGTSSPRAASASNCRPREVPCRCTRPGRGLRVT